MRPGLFLDDHGRSLYVFFSGFLFVKVCCCLSLFVGVPVKKVVISKSFFLDEARAEPTGVGLSARRPA